MNEASRPFDYLMHDIEEQLSRLADYIDIDDDIDELLSDAENMDRDSTKECIEGVAERARVLRTRLRTI
jgi:hypothetical protein